MFLLHLLFFNEYCKVKSTVSNRAIHPFVDAKLYRTMLFHKKLHFYPVVTFFSLLQKINALIRCEKIIFFHALVDMVDFVTNFANTSNF